MAILFAKSLQIIQMLDPLQLTHAETQDQGSEIEISGRTVPELSNFGNSHGFLVQRWTVNDVLSWLRQNVHVAAERMEELSKAFENEGIDGSRLLSLQRGGQACSKMSDSEWVLLNTARENLVNQENEKAGELVSKNQASSSPNSTPRAFTGEHLQNDTSSSLTSMQRSLIPSSESLLSYLKFFSLPINFWSRTNKQEQKDHATTEVFLLQEEVLSAQEREASVKARMDHLDQVLRTAKLSSYLYTRFRWTPLPGELPVADDADVDDWLQRFLVLGGATLFFYPQAADFRPQGAIILREVVDISYISGKFLQDGENINWFGFQVTTSEGFRLECATPIKLQAELWVSLLQEARVEHDPQPSPTEFL